MGDWSDRHVYAWPCVNGVVRHASHVRLKSSDMRLKGPVGVKIAWD